MVRIAMTSDNHIDINQLDADVLIQQQAECIRQQHIDIYLIAGDLFNDFNKSAAYVAKLSRLVPHTMVKFIAGNHDMLKGVDYATLESVGPAGYLHNQFVDIPNTDCRIIGNNGWYDYSFATSVDRTPEQFAAWKRAYSVDGQIKQPMADVARMDIVLTQVRAQFEAARQAGKQILFMTHFVPSDHYVHLTGDNRFWNVYVGLLGSQRLGDLISEFNVEQVLFGHLHIKPEPVQIGPTTYFNQSVGYGTKRHNEWRHATFMAEWQDRLRIIEIE